MAEIDRLGLLAAALAGRSVRLAPVEPGDPAWTDGRVVFIDAEADRRERLATVAAQAALIAAGSLAPDIVRHLRRRPGLARRYLAVEGHRALAAIDDLLPPEVRSRIDRAAAARADAPGTSLAVAASRAPIDDPPTIFGVIRPGPLLVAATRVSPKADPGRDYVPRRPGDLAELDEDDGADPAASTHSFTSPVGGSGPLATLLRRLLRPAREPGDGPPGVDAPTHRTRSGAGHGTPSVVTTPETTMAAEGSQAHGRTYPEWDVHHRRYRPDWCTVQEIVPPAGELAPSAIADRAALRRPLARLGLGLHRCRRQTQGDDVDIDAAVEARLRTLAGTAPDEAVYLDSVRRRRDLAVLLLLDISGSGTEPGPAGRSVHEHQRAAVAALALALHDLGDRVALYAFRSQGRSAVRLLPVKRFAEGLDGSVLLRLGGLEPGGYSRLGAAIRHGTATVREQGGTARRLLVVLSDGLAYDHGYERPYGAADARRALAEARRQGVGCVCLSIGATLDAPALERVFGTAAHASVPEPERLGQVIGPLFRSGLASQISVPRTTRSQPDAGR